MPILHNQQFRQTMTENTTLKQKELFKDLTMEEDRISSIVSKKKD